MCGTGQGRGYFWTSTSVLRDGDFIKNKLKIKKIAMA
jgi:hypothetical protein